MNPIIIIGSGLAGYNTAREIRKLDKEVPIHMITQDGGAFYSKPQLSTALAQNKTAEMLMAMSAEKMAATQNMTIDCHKTISAIHPDKNCIECEGEMLTYQSLVLALGASTPNPPLSGDAVDQMLHVNDVYQYDVFRQKIAGKKHVTLLGAGLVGCEFANDLILSGIDVDIIDLADSPMPQLLPKEVGTQLQQALTEKGVRFHMGTGAASVDHHNERLCITLGNDEKITTDVLLCAIGLRPHIELAQAAGLTTNRGIVVDEHLKTSADNIYALGDCAEVGDMVLPFVQPILHCAKALAATLTGQTTKIHYPAMPVSIKTTCYPICVCLPHTDGQWNFDIQGDTIRAYFRDAQNQLTGFILTKDAVKERMQLAKEIPDWI